MPEPAAAPPSPEPSLPNPSPHSEALRDVNSSSTLLSAATVTPPQGRLYNPYEGLSTQIGTKPHAFR